MDIVYIVNMKKKTTKGCKATKQVLSVRLDPDQLECLNVIAQDVGIAVPEQVRRGIDMWLKRAMGPAGCVEIWQQRKS